MRSFISATSLPIALFCFSYAGFCGKTADRLGISGLLDAVSFHCHQVRLAASVQKHTVFTLIVPPVIHGFSTTDFCIFPGVRAVFSTLSTRPINNIVGNTIIFYIKRSCV